MESLLPERNAPQEKPGIIPAVADATGLRMQDTETMKSQSRHKIHATTTQALTPDTPTCKTPALAHMKKHKVCLAENHTNPLISTL